MKTIDILKAETIGVKELRSGLSRIAKNGKPYLLTKHGKGQMFLIPYEDMVEFIEIVEESKDAFFKEEVRKARGEYRATGGVPFKD